MRLPTTGFITVLLAGAFLFWNSEAATDRSKSSVPLEEYRKLQADTSELSRQVESIRRDQINYKIEKDLLKEAYSSNLQTINQVITFVLGVFGVLGFLGIRSIREIQQDHRQELEKIRSLKGSFEDELAKLRQHQLQFDTQVKNLAEENSNQDRRLKALEIIEKVAALVRQRNYFWALQNISAGLPLSPNDTILLNYKATCLGRLGRPGEAAAVCAQLLELEPSVPDHASNLLEYQALSGQNREFEEAYRQHRASIDSRSEGGLTSYLHLLKLGFAGDTEALIKEGLLFVRDRLELPAKAYLETWSFEDANVAVAAVADARRQSLLQSVLAFFSGETSAAAFAERLRSAEKPTQ